MSRNGNNKFQLKGRLVFFATNNVNKFNEARRVLAEYDVAVGMLRVKSLEIQSDDLQKIAEASVVDAFRTSRLPIIVEDAGLFVDALNSFPGPYAAYAYKTLGNQGLLRLMEHTRKRKAHFGSAVAYMSRDLKYPRCFSGRIDGDIANEERRASQNIGFGFDPIFRPTKCRRTFAEMSVSEKNKLSHRARAFREFAKYYTT